MIVYSVLGCISKRLPLSKGGSVHLISGIKLLVDALISAVHLLLSVGVDCSTFEPAETLSLQSIPNQGNTNLGNFIIHLNNSMGFK